MSYYFSTAPWFTRVDERPPLSPYYYTSGQASAAMEQQKMINLTAAIAAERRAAEAKRRAEAEAARKKAEAERLAREAAAAEALRRQIEAEKQRRLAVAAQLEELAQKTAFNAQEIKQSAAQSAAERDQLQDQANNLKQRAGALEQAGAGRDEVIGTLKAAQQSQAEANMKNAEAIQKNAIANNELQKTQSIHNQKIQAVDSAQQLLGQELAATRAAADKGVAASQAIDDLRDSVGKVRERQQEQDIIINTIQQEKTKREVIGDSTVLDTVAILGDMGTPDGEKAHSIETGMPGVPPAVAAAADPGLMGSQITDAGSMLLGDVADESTGYQAMARDGFANRKRMPFLL